MPSQESHQSRRSKWTLPIVLFITLSALYYTATSNFEQRIHPDSIPILSLRKDSNATCSGPPIIKRVAVIGAGSAGTSTAYYLSRALASGDLQLCTNLSITIFERNSYVGGRSTTIYPYVSQSGSQSKPQFHYPDAHNRLPNIQQLLGHDDLQQPPLELGASVFVRVNTNLLHAATALNLTTQSAGNTQPSISPYSLGVWDGTSFRFLSSAKDSWWLEIGKLFYRYGLAPLWTQRAMKGTVGKFREMYSAPVFPWASLTDAVETVGLRDVVSVTGREFLEEKGIGSTFADDLIQASTRVNYAQNLGQIHGVETMVCMAAEGGTMSIQGGNWRIFEGMARTSGTDIRLNTSVRSISSLDPRKHDGARFEISFSSSKPSSANEEDAKQTQGQKQQEETESFDDIVLAAPLQFSQISTHNLHPSLTQQLPEPISYVHLHVTIFATKHRPSPSFFNVSSQDDIPETILTTLPLTPAPDTASEWTSSESQTNAKAGPGFFSLSALRNLTNPSTGETEYAYKIFSGERLSDTFLSSLFGIDVDVDTQSFSREFPWIYRHIWHSYPYLPPRQSFVGPALGSAAAGDKTGTGTGTGSESSSGLWYTSGIESFISTMETSSLAGRNVAALMVRAWNTESASAGQRVGQVEQVEQGHVDI